MSGTSSPLIRMRPPVGSINMLIIWSALALPHPDGPTKTTSSPALMSMVTLTTAGRGVPGYLLVRFSSSMDAPDAPDLSGTDPPRNGQASGADGSAIDT